MNRSSTSSSSGWRRALAPGVVALLLLLGLDSVFESSAVWKQLEAHVERGRRTGFVVQIERRLARLGLATAEKPQLVILGNSRAMAGIDPEGLEGFQVSVIARPGMEPFQQRSLAERVMRRRPDAVILVWSEFDTHRPVRLEPVVGRAVAGGAALVDLLSVTDARFAWRNRDTLLRVGLASVSNGYRYREVLGEAFGFEWRRFAELPSTPAPPPMAGRAQVAFYDAEPSAVPDSLRQQVRDVLPRGGHFVAVDQVDMVAEIRAGRHVEIQTALLRRTVERLHDAGVRVLVVEAPLHPVSQRLYDASLGRAFAGFAQGLVDDFGVGWVPLSALPPFSDSDFLDLMHVNESGRRALTRGANSALREMAEFEGN